jgi:hypothetical protein
MKTSIFVTAAALTTLLACAAPVHAQLLGGGVNGAAGGALNGSLGQGSAGGLNGSAIGRGTLGGSGNLDSDVPGRVSNRAVSRSRDVIGTADGTLKSTRDRSSTAMEATGARAMAIKSATFDKSSEMAGTARAAGADTAATATGAASQADVSHSSAVNGAADVSTATPPVHHDAAPLPDAGIASVPTPTVRESEPTSVGTNGSAAGKAGRSSGSVDASASGDTSGNTSVAGSAGAKR